MSASIVLICVFSVSVKSTGTVKKHVLTPAEVEDRIAMVETDPASFYESEKLINKSLCRKVFKQSPDLAWVEPGKG